MYRKYLQIILAFLLIFCFSSTTQAFSSMPPGKKPIPVKVGLYISDILGVNESNETILFVALENTQWQDKRLAFDAKKFGAREKVYAARAAKEMLAKIWNPQIVIMRGNDPKKIQAMYLSITHKGVVSLAMLYKVSSEIDMDLHKFPFDEQKIKISLVPFLYTAKQVQLMNFKGHNGVEKHAYNRGWHMLSFSTYMSKIIITVYKKSYSVYNLSIQYKRVSQYYIYQVFIPIILIVLLSFSVFWMTRNPLVNRVAISLTALLTIVVFQWRILNKIPHANYHTFTDIFMLVSFVITASTIFISVIFNRIPEQSKDRWARVCRIGYPILYLLIMLLVWIIFFLIPA